MAHSSPARKATFASPKQSSSPGRRPLSDYLSDDRNSEWSHIEALEHARLEHERVRLTALRISELHLLEEQQHRISEEQKKVAEAQKKEEERLRAEAALRAEQERLRELQAKKVPQLPPQPDPPKVQQPPPQPASKSQPSEKQVNGASSAGQTVAKQETPAAEAQPKPAWATAFPTASPTSTTPPGPAKPSSSPSPFAAASSATSQQPNVTQPAATKPPVDNTAEALPSADRYVEIHQGLKKLRKELEQQSKVPGSPLKGKLGEMRRAVRKAIGQLTAGKGANTQPINNIAATLRESLDGRVQSNLVDAAAFVKDKREPVEGATFNGDQLPSVFIYLLNHLAKAIIHQFTSEVSANPKSAEPIGIVTAHVFSNPDFHWRGKPMIDILVAKFRVACPVLFGARGNDRTEAGRIAVGWKREEGRWVSEQAHVDRMTGLGAGFASISLRDFSKASKKNPYPPVHYWEAVAAIVNSPQQAISNTQFTVLKAMIDGHEVRFIQFYGAAAIAALRVALVEFPKRTPTNSHNAQALQVLGQVFQKNTGVLLA